MKKIIAFLGIIILLSGCGKNNEKDIVKDLTKKINNVDTYHMTGTLEIYRNEEKYTYNVDSSYKKQDNYKVSLINQNNNHEQIILKNSKNVYVLTPALNKSFKFQSDWPNNNSQIYLLQPILTDINNDSDRTFEKDKEGYIITSKVNYASERDFKNQKVYLDKDKNITKVEILDGNKNIKMKLIVTNIDYKAKFDENYFDVSNYQKDIQDNTEEAQTENKTSKLNEIVYPMYLPTDTKLTGEDIVKTNGGERAILTFGGESSFTIVQETLKDTASTNYVYGDPYLILDTVGAITDSSVSWISNGVEYSIMSDAMNIDELLTVAQSISVKAVSK